MLVQRARIRISLLCAGTLALVLCVLAYGQTSSPSSHATPPNSQEQILNHLDLVLAWARQWNSAEVYLIRPGDALYLENGREIARQVVDLEFQSALAQAALIGNSSTKPSASGTPSPNGTNAQSILQLQQRLGQQIEVLQTQLKALDEKIPTVRAKDRPALLSQRDTVQGQLQLAQALQQNLQKLSSFMLSSEMATQGATALTSKILAQERANPTGAADQTVVKTKGKSTGAAPHATSGPALASSQNHGLIGQLGQLIHFAESLRALHNLQDDTKQLQAATQQFRAPLLAAMRSTLKQGQIELSGVGQPASPSSSAPSNAAAGTQAAPAAASAPAAAPTAATAATAAQTQQATRDLIAHFKQLSDATLPLSHELILLDQSQGNVTQLLDSSNHDFTSVLLSLLLKVAAILIALALIWLFSELWRRATFRYIHDARRRRQFLTLRRVVTGFCMFVVVLLGFVSDFSSLATYAGLITAGVAVALQAIILSIAAYFFLVGRYGVKVGDRVTVNNVAGDVVEIGLVRFYMMELAGSGIDMQPTGRICVFPNSVLFQTNPLYKQLPGAEYAWREVGLPLSADSDGELAEKELLAAANRLFATYSQTLESERSSIESTMGIAMKHPAPYTRRRFVTSGVEVMVRYPIPLREAGELDDRMVTEVTELLRKNPSIKLAAGAAPDMRSPVKV